MMIRSLLNTAYARLGEAGVPNARRNAEWMLCHAMSCSVLDLYVGDGPVDDAQRAEYERMIARRATREPLQYILGTTEFMSLPFEVEAGVFVPRPDTEVLVEIVEGYLRGVPLHERMLVADLCCGSGVIGVSLAVALSNVEVVAVDVSAAATALTRRNAERNNVSDQVGVAVADAVAFLHQGVDRYRAVVCNPPYIESGLLRALPPEVRNHEPMAALDGGPDGLDFYRAAVPEIADRLVPGGQVAFEIGDEQAAAVTGILETHGFCRVSVATDMAGRDRVVHATSQVVKDG